MRPPLDGPGSALYNRAMHWLCFVWLVLVPGLALGAQEDQAKHLYDRVMEEFHRQDYPAALAGFRLFLELHGESPLASSAQYWIGECELRLGRYHEAVRSFERVLDRYPRSPKLAAATLKKALAYDKLGMANESRILLERVIIQFPHSPEADLARKALGKG